MDWTPGPWPPNAIRAMRLHSRVACIALDALAKVAPDEAARVLDEAKDYARQLRGPASRSASARDAD